MVILADEEPAEENRGTADDYSAFKTAAREGRKSTKRYQRFIVLIT